MQCEHLNSIIALCCYVMKYCFCGAVLYNVLKHLLMIDMECGMICYIRVTFFYLMQENTKTQQQADQRINDFEITIKTLKQKVGEITCSFIYCCAQ